MSLHERPLVVLFLRVSHTFKRHSCRLQIADVRVCTDTSLSYTEAHLFQKYHLSPLLPGLLPVPQLRTTVSPWAKIVRDVMAMPSAGGDAPSSLAHRLTLVMSRTSDESMLSAGEVGSQEGPYASG